MKRLLSRRVAAHCLVFILGLLVAIGPCVEIVQAQTMPGAYRLTAGDRVSVTILGETERWETQVDLDGALRMPTLGQIQAEGMTLDAAQAALKTAIDATGLYVLPRISLSILTYAPVLVTGAVRTPGLFDYTPALTAHAAAGLAGGVAISGIDGTTLTLQATQLAGELRQIETEIQSTIVRQARIDAQLENRDEIDFDPAGSLPLLNVNMQLIDQLLTREQAILSEEKQVTKELRHLRQIELDNVEKQIAILLERSKVQDDLLRLQQEERNAADTLDARGLRTRMDMAQVQRNEATLQAQVLDIEAALSQARTRRADIASTMTQSRSDRRRILLEEATRLRAAVEQKKQERRTILEKSLIIGDPSVIAFAGGTGPTISYTIRRRRGGSIKMISAGPEDRVMPGDVVQVDVETQSQIATGAAIDETVSTDLSETN